MSDTANELDWADVPDESGSVHFEDHVRVLLRASGRVLKSIGSAHPLYQQFSDAIGNVETWYESDDPIANGWVGSDGRP